MCKRCGTRMWDDDDGTIYCPNCGWEPNTPVDTDEVDDITYTLELEGTDGEPE